MPTMSLVQIDWNPDHRRLREFAVIWLAGFAVIGTIVAWRLGCFTGTPRWGWPAGLWAAALVVGLTGSLAPAVVRPIYLLWMGLALPLGLVTGHIILGLVYYGLFTPIGVLFRLIGRDPLDRSFVRTAPTYWVERSGQSPPESYFCQF
jgi:hypothetical protein